MMNATLAASALPSALLPPRGALPAAAAALSSAPSATATLVAAWALWTLASTLFARAAAARAMPGDAQTSAHPLALGVSSLLAMVRDPDAFWERQRRLAPDGLSWNVLSGALCLFVANASVVNEVLRRSDGRRFGMVLHPNANIILGRHNIAFLHGAKHKALRASFLPLFTKRALGMYLPLQQHVIERHLACWVAQCAEGEGAEVEARELCRDMNLETSQAVFLGPRLRAQDVAGFNLAFMAMVEAFLALPVFLPGTALWRGWRGRHCVLRVLRRCARAAFEAHAAGEEPQCLLDLWVARIVADVAEAKSQHLPRPAYASVDAVADSVMDFLFASQDASTASLTWAVAHVAGRPEVAAQVRAEAAPLLAGGAALTYDGVTGMTYTWQVVKEILRFRPPATMVPQVAKQDVTLQCEGGGGFTVRKGTLVMPSLYAASMQGFTQPEKFDPERFGEARREDLRFKEHFVPFGVGPHMCVGYQYAMNHLVAFVAILATKLDVSRRLTDRSDDVLYYPTIYPYDCLCKFAEREESPIAQEAQAHALAPAQQQQQQQDVQVPVKQPDVTGGAISPASEVKKKRSVLGGLKRMFSSKSKQANADKK